MCKLWSFMSLGRKSLTHQYSATRISYLQFVFKCRGPQTWGPWVPRHGDPGSPSNTMWPGPMPTFVLSAILINPALWPQRTFPRRHTPYLNMDMYEEITSLSAYVWQTRAPTRRARRPRRACWMNAGDQCAAVLTRASRTPALIVIIISSRSIIRR